MYAIQRWTDRHLFALPEVPKRWTDEVVLAVHYADKRTAEEQAERLPYPVEVIPVFQHERV